MREELRKKLSANSARLVSELDVSISFLASLLTKGVIKEEHKSAIQNERLTDHEKVNKLIDVLGRRPDAMFESFCNVLREENSDLADLLTESSACSSTVHEVSSSASATNAIEQPSGPEQTRWVEDQNNHNDTNRQTPTPANIDKYNTEINEDNQHTGPKQMTFIGEQYDEEINLNNPSSSDITKYVKGFEKVRHKLDDYIDPLNKLPACFVDHEIMTPDEAEEIENLKPNSTSQIVTKMKECLKKDFKNCLPILKALIENDQRHIANFIVSSGKNTHSPDRVLTKEQRDAIDQNMFCLEKLVRPHVNEYLVPLAGLKCITSSHKDWVINWRRENKDVYQLFEIMKRRSFKHLTIFNSLLVERGHTLIADVLEKGGVVEITNHMRGIEYLSDKEKISIERGIVEQLCVYPNDAKESKLNKQQMSFIDELIALLYKHQIRFAGCYPTNSIALYFQCETDESQDWLTEFCKTGLKSYLKTLYQILQPELYRLPNFDLNVSLTNSSKIHSMHAQSQYKSECRPGVDFGPHEDHDDNAEIRSRFLCQENMARLINAINNLKQQWSNKLTMKSCQLRIHRREDEDFEEIVQKFYETETDSILNKLKPIKDQWRILDLWKLVQSVNPSPILEFLEKTSGQTDEKIPENPQDRTAFERWIVLCCIFEDLMRKLGWKVGDTLDIENDICNTIGKLMMEVEKQEISSLMDCMQSAMMNIQTHRSKRDGDKLRQLLITKKKYNGLNLACILLEQMILDNKDNNVSWMRIVCIQLIDLVVQLIIEPGYQENIRRTLNSLLKLTSNWSVADIYNLLRNGIVLFQYRNDYFSQYLIRIPDLAIHIRLAEKSLVCSKSILYCRDKNKLNFLNNEMHENKDKSLDQILIELKPDEVGQEEKFSMKQIINGSNMIMETYKVKYDPGIELDRILKSELNDSVDVLSSCLAVTSMALYTCKKFWPSNTQLVSYCLLVHRKMQNRGRLLEILTGEGKSCIIAMVAATLALLGRTVDIITSSPVLSQRDAEEWRTFYNKLNLSASCNVREITEEDTGVYGCPIVYGTVETFARDILKSEFLFQDVRKLRKCDIVIVDEVDSMLIDQGVQCTYLSHDLASTGMSHFEPILALIWMHVSRLVTVNGREGIVYCGTEPELFFVTLSRLSNEIDPLPSLRFAENDDCGISEGFTDKYLRADVEEQERLLRDFEVPEIKQIFRFEVKNLNLDIAIIDEYTIPEQTSILVLGDGLSTVVISPDMMKERLTKMIIDVLSEESCTTIVLPVHLREYCIIRLEHWINNAFVAKQMTYGREYIVENNAIYPVDYESTGVIETNKKWGDGLQQFLEMKHGLPLSPLSLVTNFLSNIALFERYDSNILGVSGTLGNDGEKKFVDDTFSVEFATIPTSKRRKLFELDGQIMTGNKEWRYAIVNQVESAVENERAVLIICEDITTAEYIKEGTHKSVLIYTKNSSDDVDHVKKVLKPRDVVITTNLGARGSDFVIDDIVNKNGGLFVLVTFIPLNDRVEKQAFGRTGRRGATGSCQILVNRDKMPEWLKQCETIDEAKRLRDSIEMRRLQRTDEVEIMRNKHALFREYCDLKHKFVTSSNCDLNDLSIQAELLDETWAKWLQDNETTIHESNLGGMKQDLRQIIEVCIEQVRRLDSDNICHLLKFGAVRLMKGDFEASTIFFDRVIRMDPAWSAFAHYNRAYCTIQLKGDGYIRRAIDDLKATLCKLGIYKQTFVFSKVHAHATTYSIDNDGDKHDDDLSVLFQKNIKFTKYYTMMECQLLHHIDTQIIETIETLERIDTKDNDVKIERRNILDLIPNGDCVMKKLLEKYRQIGLLFTFNINKKPTFCYESKIVSSLVVIEVMSDILLRLEFQGISSTADSQFKSKYIDELLCNLGTENDDSLAWMSRCVGAAITTGIRSIKFMRDVSSFVKFKQPKIESTSETNSDTSEFPRVSRTQTRHWFTLLETTKQDMKKLTCSTGDELVLHITNVVMGVLVGRIKKTIHEKLKPGQNLHRELCTLYGSVTSQFGFELPRFVDCIQDLALAHSLQICDANFETVDMTKLVTEFVSNSLNDIKSTNMNSVNTEISVTAAEIDIRATTAISKISDSLTDSISTCIQHMADVGCINNDGAMLEAINKAITSVCSDNIRSIVHSRIYHAFMLDLREKTMRSCSSIYKKLINAKINFKNGSESKYSVIVSRCSSRVKEETRELCMRSINATLLCQFYDCNLLILDANKEIIITYSSPDNYKTVQLVYNPPCCEFPGGHYDVYKDGEVVQVTCKKLLKDEDEDKAEDDLLYSAIATALDEESFISCEDVIRYQGITHIHQFGELLVSEHYACQLKHGRALVRLGMNHPTTQIDYSKHVQLDSSHLLSCIEQACKSENVSQLARAMAQYESESKSDVERSFRRKTKAMPSEVSRDALEVFSSSGRSVEAEVYRQLVVERINDGDITTALQLCCIGHQMVFGRNIRYVISSTSDPQTLGYTFDQIKQCALYGAERTKFMSVCDEWYKVLEPQGLMNTCQINLLRKWITERQYANIEDCVVSQLIGKCSITKKNEKKRKSEGVDELGRSLREVRNQLRRKQIELKRERIRLETERIKLMKKIKY